MNGYQSSARPMMSGNTFLMLKLTSLVKQDPRPGVRELGLVLSVVVSAEQQFVVAAIRDDHTDQHIGSRATPIAAIGHCKNDTCHGDASLVVVGSPWCAEALIASFACRSHYPPRPVEVSIRHWS